MECSDDTWLLLVDHAEVDTDGTVSIGFKDASFSESAERHSRFGENGEQLGS